MNRLGVAVIVLWPTAILLFSGSETSRIQCKLETNTCVSVDMLAGVTVKRAEFPASEFTDAIIQGESIGSAHGNRTHGVGVAACLTYRAIVNYRWTLKRLTRGAEP